MEQAFQLFPVGRIHKTERLTEIEIYKDFEDALLGLDAFSHIMVFYWLHENDSPEKRRILQVHPRKNPKNPLTGVFGTHSPVRPNPMALSVCRVEAISGGRIRIDDIDAFDGSPVIDLKSYTPPKEPLQGFKVPSWVHASDE